MQQPRKSRKWKSVGLFPRLVAAFVVIGVGGVVAASGATYLAARGALLMQEQNNHLNEFNIMVDAFFGDGKDFHHYDPGILDSAHELLTQPARIEVVGSSLSGGDLAAAAVPNQLRDLVERDELTHYQRTMNGLRPVFYVGRYIPIENGTQWTGNGLRIFVAYPLEGAAELAIRTLIGTFLIAILAASVGTYVARRIVSPLRELTAAIGKMPDSPQLVPIPVSGWGEISTLTRKLNETSEQLDLSMSDLRDSENGARRFVADVSHELRTPVAALLALTEVLPEEAGQLSEPQARAVDITKNEVIKLARLIEDLLEISRFDAGQAPVRATHENLADLTAQGIASRGWDVEYDLDEGIETAIDARRWDLIVANLVSNAFRHGKPPVNVTLDMNRAEIILTVTSHGEPIPPEALPHIFERFYKAEHARTRSEGSGLGLAITAENVRLLGGTIKVESEVAATRFTVALPLGDARMAHDEPDLV